MTEWDVTYLDSQGKQRSARVPSGITPPGGVTKIISFKAAGQPEPPIPIDREVALFWRMYLNIALVAVSYGLLRATGVDIPVVAYWVGTTIAALNVAGIAALILKVRRMLRQSS